MAKKVTNNSLLGIILLVLGAILLLQALNVIPGSIFFAGWWTLFLIVPAIFSMSKVGVRVGNAILLTLGIGFLLQEQGLTLNGYLVPILFIVVGVVIVTRR